MSRPSGLRRLISILLTVLGLAGAGGILIVMFGRVSCTEFAPGSFKFRSYTYYQLPLIRLQISPTFRWEEPNATAQYLRTANLVRSVPTMVHWHLIDFDGESGPAAILTGYLEESSSATWQDWSKTHPEKAKCLWSAVQEAAELNAYELTPFLFELANSASDVQEFCRRVDRSLAESYDELAVDYERQQDGERAKSFREAAERRRTAKPVEAKANSTVPVDGAKPN